jgi:hypothetical protein
MNFSVRTRLFGRNRGAFARLRGRFGRNRGALPSFRLRKTYAAISHEVVTFRPQTEALGHFPRRTFIRPALLHLHDLGS